MWDPGQYQLFAGYRSRPFHDLLARVGAADPRLVADLGCGPGDLTATLAQRWPDAEVTGVDSSPEMIEAARASQARASQARASQARASQAGSGRDGPAARVSFTLGDLRDWKPERPAGVIVANAVLQWLPDQLTVLAGWPALLAPGGWLALQVPGNFDQPGHEIIRQLAAAPRWRPVLGSLELNRQTVQPAQYLDVLARAGCEVDVWETTYSHVLPGADPVTEWYKGSGLRPVLNVLGPAQTGDFLAEYGALVRAAYPAQSYGTVLPFRRVFAVARIR
jgi:trans-aconitate 2-methyltransferase